MKTPKYRKGDWVTLAGAGSPCLSQVEDCEEFSGTFRYTFFDRPDTLPEVRLDDLDDLHESAVKCATALAEKAREHGVDLSGLTIDNFNSYLDDAFDDGGEVRCESFADLAWEYALNFGPIESDSFDDARIRVYKVAIKYLSRTWTPKEDQQPVVRQVDGDVGSPFCEGSTWVVGGTIAHIVGAGDESVSDFYYSDNDVSTLWFLDDDDIRSVCSYVDIEPELFRRSVSGEGSDILPPEEIIMAVGSHWGWDNIDPCPTKMTIAELKVFGIPIDE